MLRIVDLRPLIVSLCDFRLVVQSTVPDCLKVTAQTASGVVMGVRHKEMPWIEGVQFHPESILTDHGKQLLENFLNKTVG